MRRILQVALDMDSHANSYLLSGSILNMDISNQIGYLMSVVVTLKICFEIPQQQRWCTLHPMSRDRAAKLGPNTTLTPEHQALEVV